MDWRISDLTRWGLNENGSHFIDNISVCTLLNEKFFLFLYPAVKDVFIVSAKRTAFGTYGGKLVKHTATDLLEIANKAALSAANINPEIVDSVIVGNVCPVSS